jgi:hypothetical protein
VQRRKLKKYLSNCANPKTRKRSWLKKWGSSWVKKRNCAKREINNIFRPLKETIQNELGI